MQRKVTFTPRRFLKKIWQLGNFDVSPDGRWLAFAANKGDQWSVYLLDLRTKKDRILLQSEQSVLNPEFSPDGRWIAVQSVYEGDENYTIYLVPVRGAHVQKITDTPFDSAFPRWSPDGTKIAFLSNRDRDRDNVFVVDTGGGDARQLTNVDDIVGEIAWRPDGQSIAFCAGVGLLDYGGLVDLAGHMEKIVAFPDSESAIGGDLGRPRPWSPDGRELAFVSNVHDHVDLGVLDVKTKKVRFLVQSRWDKAMPLWAPDGWRIPLLENRDGNVQLKTVSRDGKGARAVSPAKGSASRAVWTPDAKGLFYQHSEFTQPTRLILRRGERAVTLVDSLREPLPKDELAPGKLVRYPSVDGRTISAWLFVPRKERRRNAALVDPHGGPETTERGYLRRYDRQKMGEPEVDADLYRKFSPIYFLDEIRAPVLFTGGAHDPRCPVTEARAMVEEMRKMGKVVDYLEFADEGHWPRKISNQIRLNERTLEWLKQYLPDR